MSRQLAAVVAMNLMSLPQRVGSSSVIVVGIMGVVLVLISVLTLGTGLERSMRATGRPDRAIILREGTETEAVSTLFVDEARTIIEAPGIARTPEGDPAATADIVTSVHLPRIADGAPADLIVRGMSPQGTAVRPEIQIVEGRFFRPGIGELIVGRAAQREFDGLALGDQVRLRGGAWTVVGAFRSESSLESTMLTDAATLMSAYRRALYSSVTVRLESPSSLEELEAALERSPNLPVQVMREPDYYERLSGDLRDALYVVSYAIGAIMAIGAVFGALNTMYSAVSARGPEIATLRAIGFGAFAVAVSVLVEALLLAVLGGLAGAAVAWLVLSGNTFALGAEDGAVVMQLDVTAELLGVALVWACIVGCLGGLLPAIRAARLPVATALKPV